MKMGMIALATGLAFSAQAAHSATIYGVDEVNNLVTFDSGNPLVFTSTVRISGLTGSIQAIDFRPLNGALYGLGADKVVYTINTATGAATAVGGALAINGTEFAFDFNPTIDRLRIVSNTNENYVFDPNSGGLTTATPVFYPVGDPNAGGDADVTGGAYTSSVFGAAAGTTQLYAIDTARDLLVRQANSAGTLTTVGATGVELGSRTSFDIVGTDAFAFNGSTLYRVNLDTGAFTRLGDTNRSLFGIAAAVPEPSTWAMMLTGFALVGGAVRYRRRRVGAAIA